MSYLKIFSYILQVFMEMFAVILLVTSIMPMLYSLFIVVVVVSCLCVYLSCWVATYVYSWINIYRGWTNNGNTIQYRNKTVCVGFTERKLVASFIILFCLFVLCSASVSALSVHYQLCLVTVCMKALQNGRLLRFSKRTGFWCAFNWSIRKQNGHFIRCIQSSSFQGYKDIHIIRGPHQLWGIVVENQN